MRSLRNNYHVLEEIFKDLVLCPCHGQGHLSIDQLAQSPNTSSNGASTISLGNTFHCLTTLIVKKLDFFLYKL